MVPTGSQRRREGYSPMELKKPTRERNGEPKRDARGVYARLSDELFSLLTNRATDNPLSTKLTRAKFLKAVGAGVAWIALTNTPGSEPVGRAPNVQSFRSRPDLSPPAVAVTKQAHDTARGYIFVAPK